MAKILIIEDNQDIRYNLVDFLEAKGHQTDNTDDDLKALALLTMQQFDIIVLDIMLPGMDGISLCRELRARGNETPVLFLSAKDTVADRIEGLSTGADDYLVKPFSLAAGTAHRRDFATWQTSGKPYSLGCRHRHESGRTHCHARRKTHPAQSHDVQNIADAHAQKSVCRNT